MKVFIKILDGTRFQIQVKPEDTVANVKKIIETVKGANVYPAVRQMLIHQAKILKDGTTLEENSVAENNDIVIMVSRNKSLRSSAVASTSANTVKVGIPEQGELPPSAGALAVNRPAHPEQATQLPAVPRSGSNTPAAAPNNLDFLRSSRHFQPLCTMVMANGRTFEPILNELANHNPELKILISENEDDFFRLLDEPPEDRENPLNWNFVSVESCFRIWTIEDLLAIERLEALGFNNLLVSEVFYTCNKDEEEAVSFLLSHMSFED